MIHAVEELEDRRGYARQHHIRKKEQRFNGSRLHLLRPLGRRAKPLEGANSYDEQGEQKWTNGHDE